MVVGGGIAGMQASLDLADQGYQGLPGRGQVRHRRTHGPARQDLPHQRLRHVHHLPQAGGDRPPPEHRSARRHRGRRASTGRPATSRVTLRKKPRYIDLTKCVGCGDCANVCPVVLPDAFNEGLSQRRAAYKLYPQAVPNAYAIEKHGVAPCRDACPAGQRAQGYIALIREGRYHGRLRVIKEDNPFPGHLRAHLQPPLRGRLQPRPDRRPGQHPCPQALRDRQDLRRTARRPLAAGRGQVRAAGRRSSAPGPCGLTAAQDLAKLGYRVTVFEALPVAGGMLRVGVPEYRLPAAIIEREVDDILDLGVELRLNTRVDDLDGYSSQGFKAVLVAVGAHEGVRLPIPGADLPGVLINTQFLRDVRLDRAARAGRAGAGARRRQRRHRRRPHGGAPGRQRSTWPAWSRASRCRATRARSRRRRPRASPSTPAARSCAWCDGDGRAAGVECRNVLSFAFDPDGRLTVETEPDSEHVLEARHGDLLRRPAGRPGLHPRRRGRRHHPPAHHRRQPQHVGRHAAGRVRRRRQRLRHGLRHRGRGLRPPARRRASTATCRARRSSSKPKPELPVVKLESRSRRVPALDETHARPGRACRCRSCPCEAAAHRASTRSSRATPTSWPRPRRPAAWRAAGARSACRASTPAAQRPSTTTWSRRWSRSRSVPSSWRPATRSTAPSSRRSTASGATRTSSPPCSSSACSRPPARRPATWCGRPTAKPAQRIAFLQCIGSRDQSHDYCSAVCCMYATKEAVMATRARARRSGRTCS